MRPEDSIFALVAPSIAVWLLSLGVFFALYLHYRKSSLRERARRNSHDARLRRLHNNIPGIVYQATTTPGSGTRTIYISDRISEYGVTPQEIYADEKAITNLIHPDDAMRVYITLAKCAQFGTNFHEEYRLLHGDVTSWIEVRAIPTREDDGSITWDGMMIDITARKLAEEALRASEDRLKLMALALANSPNGVCLAEVSGESMPIVYLNPAYSEITGYSQDEAVGQQIFFLHDNPDNQENLRTLQSFLSLGIYKRHVMLTKRKDGSEYWCDFSLSPIRNRFGDITHYVVVLSNITDLKNTQQKLEQANLELQANNAALEEARKVAEAATIVKRDFLANMSHEIRTPLFGILGTVQLLARSSLNKDQKQWVNILRHTGDSLFSLINDILDFSKIESGNIELEETAFNPAQLADEVLELHRRAATGKRIIFTLDVDRNLPRIFLGDSERIRQILGNFISNAIKFTESGKISISVDLLSVNTRNDDYRVRFSVTDSGRGIARENLERIFEQFTQEDASTSRRYGGTGLGLAISKQLAELMHGNVGVESQLGKGSTFWLDLYLNRPSEDAVGLDIQPAAFQPRQLQFNDSRILLAEDNPINRTVITAMLDQLGIKVKTVENGAEAVDAYRQSVFDIVLMDVQMPIMGGFEATKLIRLEEETSARKRTPVIAFTANVTEGFRQECIDSGMDDYLPKPLRADLLAKTLQQYIAPSGQESDEKILPMQEIPTASISIPHLDTLKTLMGKQFPELCETFFEDSAMRLGEIRQNIQLQDYAQMSRVAHSLKSATLNMGAPVLFELCRKLEGHNMNDGEDSLTLLQAAEEEFLRVKNEITTYLQQ
ncbi:MAG: PAS domain S-box protein [Alphaproteobacteria bacterium]|nr:PAS domain S-box protein [Alphaproteobacteria bacterium]